MRPGSPNGLRRRPSASHTAPFFIWMLNSNYFLQNADNGRILPMDAKTFGNLIWSNARTERIARESRDCSTGVF
ncbi:hypothetical protein ERO13_A03G073966v2 [Gossypium hirsutum]|nr:hypothetical protein ERO13_A03G073966v2 [Gossypium hirsutum]